MKTITQLINLISGQPSTEPTQTSTCNYANDYYGDRLCRVGADIKKPRA